MAHFVKLNEKNEIEQMIVVNNEVITDENGIEQEALGIAFCKSLYGEDGNWVQTSINNNFRNMYAGHATHYDPVKDEFINQSTEGSN